MFERRKAHSTVMSERVGEVVVFGEVSSVKWGEKNI